MPTWPQVVARYGQATADRLVATGLLNAVTCTATPGGELDIPEEEIRRALRAVRGKPIGMWD